MSIDVMEILDRIVIVPDNVGAEILQNIKTLLSTPKGTVQLTPDFGVDLPVDKPSTFAKAQLTHELTEAIEKWEPRAKVETIDWENLTAIEGLSGAYYPRIRITLNGEVA